MVSKSVPRLCYEKDLRKFKLNPINRPLHSLKDLIKSMQEVGFLPGYPLRVVRDLRSGKLLVISGHHRLEAARALKIGVYYVEEFNVPASEPREVPGQNWTAREWAYARKAGGNKECAKVIDFADQHSIPIGIATTLLLGMLPAGSSAANAAIKDGSLVIGKDGEKFAAGVAKVTDHMRSLGVDFATSRAFIHAITLALQVPNFDPDRLMAKATQWPKNIGHRATMLEYLDEIDSLYNRGSSKRIPLAHEAGDVYRMLRRDQNRKSAASHGK